MRRGLIAILMLAALLVCTACLATTWPQSFKLFAGQNTKFTFDVTAAGQIVADVTWQGSQLYVALLDPSGKAVNTPTLQSSPAKIIYNMTAADIQKGATWTVGIATPPAKAQSQAPVAQGQVSVKVPVVFHPNIQRPPVRPVEPHEPIVPPTLTGITPDVGSPNDTVTITGVGIPPEKNKIVVWFTIAQNQPVQGTIIDGSSDAKGVVTYHVRVPGNDYLTKSYDGPVYVKLLAAGTTTNELIFHFVPCPPPTITSHSPQYGAPNRQMTFTGTRFKYGARVVFSFDGAGGEYGGQSVQVISPTQIKVTIPDTLPTNISKKIYAQVRNTCGANGGWVYGPKYGFPMDPAAMTSPNPK